jgi:putative hydrolase of the HAD superfamily
MLTTVLFDLDETLILDEPVCEHAFLICALGVTQNRDAATRLAHTAAECAKALWAALPADALEYANRIGHSAYEGLWARYDLRNPSEAMLEAVIEEYRLGTWSRALETCDLHGDPRALSQLWIALRSRYPLYPDVDELLVRLRARNLKLGIVTNGVRLLQRQKLEGCGLMHWMDAVVISGEAGIGKPERGIFEVIARELKVPLETCVMVGDNTARDVQGGINAGMKTVWVERGFRPKTVAASLEVKALLEIAPWVESQV